MRRRIWFIVGAAILLSSCFFGDDLKGIYREDSSNLGILIEPAESGEGYVVNRVFLNSSGTIRQRFEWQTAFIDPISLDYVFFYWKTGRVEDSMPESNKLIVYKLSLNNKNLVGSYFFPEESRTHHSEVRFIKIKN